MPATLALICSCATAPLAPDVDARVRASIDRVLAPQPEQPGASLAFDVGVSAHAYALAAMQSDDVFFESNFAVGDAVAVAARCTRDPIAYDIAVNPRAFALGASDDELDGVLAHEVAHTVQYWRAAHEGLAALAALAAFAVDDGAALLERQADLIAVHHGFGDRLAAWRQRAWRTLPNDVVADKRARYYSPLELRLLADVNRRCPRLIDDEHAPLDVRALVTRCP